jgi:hypothetical protein
MTAYLTSVILLSAKGLCARIKPEIRIGVIVAQSKCEIEKCSSICTVQFWLIYLIIIKRYILLILINLTPLNPPLLEKERGKEL